MQANGRGNVSLFNRFNPVTVLELLQGTAAYFERKGVESGRLNIEHLLAEALGKRRIDVYLEFDRTLDTPVLDKLRDQVRRRVEGEPLQHLLGHWDFYGRKFQTDARALIPRPETEVLVELLLKKTPPDVTGHLIDVGTGSGIIGISLALERPGLAVTASDLSPSALALAKENALQHGAKIEFYLSDLLDAVPGEFQFVVANLPYIPRSEIETLSKEVRRDPRMALDGGIQGVELIERLIASMPNRLVPNALILLEVGQGQAISVARNFAAEKFRDISIENDYQGQQRFVCARYG